MANFGNVYENLVRQWLDDEGDHRCESSKLYSVGKSLYSYGAHFKLAEKIGNHEVQINSDKSTSTTARQRNILIKACKAAKINVTMIPGLQ